MNTILDYLHSGFTYVFSFVILLGALVFVHELGHFLVAVFNGVRVEVFSLGFGKKIFQYQKGDTNYCVSLIPLGGYVKMYGEQPGDEIPEDQKKYSYTHKKVGQRLAIVLAGPLMNLFFAFFVFMAVAITGEIYKTPVLGEVTPGSKAETFGFKTGDKILEVNNEKISTWDQFQESLDKNIDSTATFLIQHENATESETITAPISAKNNPNVVSTQSYVGNIDGISMFSYAPVVAVNIDSELYKLGMRSGDRIESINELPVNHFRDLNKTIQTAVDLSGKSTQTQLIFKIIRNELDKKASKKLTFTLNNVSSTEPLTMEKLGLESTQLYVDKVMPNSPAEQAGLEKGDKIIAINSKVLQGWDDILISIKSYNPEQKSLALKILRDNKPLNLTITPHMTSQMTIHGTEDKRFTIGISPFIMYAQPETVVIAEQGFSNIVSKAYIKTKDVSVMTVMSFIRLIQNKLSPKNIGGIFSIAQAANDTFKIGLSPFLQMMGLLSINLFILNLLPIPMLDGGHVVFYCIEAIKGSPLSLNKLELAHKVGMILLFGLMFFALFNDFKRMLGFM